MLQCQVQGLSLSTASLVRYYLHHQDTFFEKDMFSNHPSFYRVTAQEKVVIGILLYSFEKDVDDK